MYNKLISIYVPTFNRSEKVVKQLRFLLKELDFEGSEQIEIVVNNNCSTDDTEEKVLEVIKGTAIRYHRNATNLGIVGNIYAAPDLLTGKFFWAIGDDDYLSDGIVKRAYDILKKNSEISYLFLNYSDISNENEVVYEGPDGILKDSIKVLSCGRIHGIIFTSANIYLKKSLDITVEQIPINGCESYGWSGYAALTSLKLGEAYIDKKVWLHSDSNNKSWQDIAYDSQMGIVHMFAQLKHVGYSQREIATIYRHYISTALIGGRVCLHFAETGDIKRFAEDMLFCFIKAPWNIVVIMLELIYGRIKRFFERLRR